MKKIGFVGAYDKTDLILYVARILTKLEKKVIVVDATITQKAKYVIPTLNPTVKYITEFEQIDVAVGFRSYDDLEQYIDVMEGRNVDYDFMLIDTDNMKGFNTFGVEEADKNYFVTSFDAYSLKRGLEILSILKNTITMKRVFFAKVVSKDDRDYLKHLSSGYKIIWDQEEVDFPIENGDLSIIYENHKVEKLRLKKMSALFKDGISYIADDILGGGNDGPIRKAIKSMERGM